MRRKKGQHLPSHTSPRYTAAWVTLLASCAQANIAPVSGPAGALRRARTRNGRGESAVRIVRFPGRVLLGSSEEYMRSDQYNKIGKLMYSLGTSKFFGFV